jgi:VCBS repeat-containing protein
MKVKKSIFQATIAVVGVLSLSGCFDSDSYSDEVEVAPVNRAPSAVSINLITQTEVPITDQLSGSDPEGETLMFMASSEPQLGSLIIDATGWFTYQPFDEVTGSDSFTYVVKDQVGLEASAIINITIEALQLSFLNYSRQAFTAPISDKALLLNGRVFVQDANDQGDYQDLIDNN